MATPPPRPPPPAGGGAKPDVVQGRRWCWTLNNPSEAEITNVRLLADSTVYTVFGHEVGAEGTPHLQGFTVYSATKRLAAVKKDIPRAHWETTKGTNQQAGDYCKKDGNYEEFGTMPAPRQAAGGRESQRWADAYAAAQAGNTDVIPGDIMLRSYRTIKEVVRDHMKHPDDVENVCGLWLWGPPGVGKSRKAREDFPDFFNKPCNKWWDGYQGEPVVLLDDFDPSHRVLGHHLKIWADRYAFIGETKGSSRAIRPHRIVVTSQFSPDTIWADDADTLAAIRRRYRVVHMEVFPPAQEEKRQKV